MYCVRNQPRERTSSQPSIAAHLQSRAHAQHTRMRNPRSYAVPPIRLNPQTKSAFTCIRGIIVDNNRPAEPAQCEEEIIDMEVEVIAERIISDWRQLHQSLMHTSLASPNERRKEEEEPTQGPALPPIRMKKRSAYTTDQEVEEIMKHQGSWDIVDPQPAEKKIQE
ncbi:hypothetical protein DAPPUDRAFT_263835 [Daphnia pulex]|uniref:Uncharacterized protein n=1 Tax=Daphnia pulex TaxID=6669 RepID=E9HQH3_DAPPU|nr:hypothetical protein DAPPUDRAFT_263835 [Daphnia pulex]|eukprot:EFX66000.1 hypothetical protein DAPPUDRAFT_263835 [Daphnia pulex]